MKISARLEPRQLLLGLVAEHDWWLVHLIWLVIEIQFDDHRPA